MEPRERTSTTLNPTVSLDLRSLTYSLAWTSLALKWVFPFSLWNPKKTNLPRKRETAVLKLITSVELSSDLRAPGRIDKALFPERGRRVERWRGRRPLTERLRDAGVVRRAAAMEDVARILLW